MLRSDKTSAQNPFLPTWLWLSQPQLTYFIIFVLKKRYPPHPASIHACYPLPFSMLLFLPKILPKTIHLHCSFSPTSTPSASGDAHASCTTDWRRLPLAGSLIFFPPLLPQKHVVTSSLTKKRLWRPPSAVDHHHEGQMPTIQPI